MRAIQEINMMVKSAGKYGNTYSEIYSNFSKMTPAQRQFNKMPAQDPELKKLLPNKRPMSDGERFYAQEAKRRQMAAQRQNAMQMQGRPAGKSIGSGYTGNEVRHGGTYASKGQVAWGAGNAAGYQNREQWENSPTYQLMQGKRTMAPYSDIKGKDGKVVRSARQQYEDSFLPNNKPQYTYAGSQPRAVNVPAAGTTSSKGTTWNEFGAGNNSMGVPGTSFVNREIVQDGSAPNPPADNQSTIRNAPISTAPRSAATPPSQIPPITTSVAKNAPTPQVSTPKAQPAQPNTAQYPTQPPVPHMYEDVGMDELNVDNQNAASNWSSFVPNQPEYSNPAQAPSQQSTSWLDALKNLFTFNGVS